MGQASKTPTKNIVEISVVIFVGIWLINQVPCFDAAIDFLKFQWNDCLFHGQMSIQGQMDCKIDLLAFHAETDFVIGSLFSFKNRESTWTIFKT